MNVGIGGDMGKAYSMWTQSEQQAEQVRLRGFTCSGPGRFLTSLLPYQERLTALLAHYRLVEWEGICILTELAAVSSGCLFVFVVARSDFCHDGYRGNV
jgi:hypothetical protein